MPRPSKDDYFMNLAIATASRSCCRRKVGCVLLDKDWNVLSLGYNGPPSGVANCCDLPCHKTSCNNKCNHTLLLACPSVHAEQNALIRCHDFRLIHKAYLTRAPCNTCGLMLANTACQELVLYEASSYTNVEVFWTIALQRSWRYHYV